MTPHVSLPNGDTEADEIARELAKLRGPEIDASDGTFVAEHLRVLGGALAAVRSTIRRAVDQSHAATVGDLLAEVEAQYGLQPDASLSLDDRRARLRAQMRARRAATGPAILATVRAVAPTATLRPAGWTSTEPRTAHRFAVVVPVAVFDGALHAVVRSVVEQQKQLHADARITTRIGLRCDDPESRLDDALLDP